MTTDFIAGVNAAGGKATRLRDKGVHRCGRARLSLSCGLLIGACLWPWSSAVRAHLPQLFGYEFVRAEDDLIADPPAVPAAQDARLELSAPGNPYDFLKQVAEQEIASGPYAAGLTEPLSSLGLHFQRLGDYAGARDAYQRALHIARVNDGLNSERQIPILRQLMAIYRTTGDYDALAGVYIYYDRLRFTGAPPYVQTWIKDGLEYLRWEREAYAMRTDGKQLRHVLQAYFVNKRILKAIAAEPDIQFESYEQMALSQLKNLYLVLGSDELLMVAPGENAGTGGGDSLVDMQIASIQQGAFIQGRRLLRDLIGRAKTSSPREMAALYLELGDWYQWNGKYLEARREYAEVVSILRGANEEQLLEQWLDQPVELPDESSYWQRNWQRAGQGKVVVARYKVSARGEVSSVQVSASGEGDNGAARRIKSMLKDTHFRPRFSEGKAVRSDEIIRGYSLVQ